MSTRMDSSVPDPPAFDLAVAEQNGVVPELSSHFTTTAQNLSDNKVLVNYAVDPCEKHVPAVFACSLVYESGLKQRLLRSAAPALLGVKVINPFLGVSWNRSFLFLFTLFIVLLCLLILKASPIPPPQQPDKYNVLGLSWPMGYCFTGPGEKNKCVGVLPRRFTIHGLWPTCTGIHNCLTRRDEDYEEPNDEAQIEMLSFFWPNLNEANRASNSRFWSHEWKDHGVFSLLANTSDYLYMGMHLFNSLDLQQKLRKYEIKVGAKRATYNAVMAMMREVADGHTPVILCDYGNFGTRYNNKLVLYEIHICFDWSFKNIIDCPGPSKCYSKDNLLINF